MATGVPFSVAISISSARAGSPTLGHEPDAGAGVGRVMPAGSASMIEVGENLLDPGGVLDPLGGSGRVLGRVPPGPTDCCSRRRRKPGRRGAGRRAAPAGDRGRRRGSRCVRLSSVSVSRALGQLPWARFLRAHDATSQRRRTNCRQAVRRSSERPGSRARRIAACGCWRSGAADSRSRGWALRATVLPILCRRVGMVSSSRPIGRLIAACLNCLQQRLGPGAAGRAMDSPLKHLETIVAESIPSRGYGAIKFGGVNALFTGRAPNRAWRQAGGSASEPSMRRRMDL